MPNLSEIPDRCAEVGEFRNSSRYHDEFWQHWSGNDPSFAESQEACSNFLQLFSVGDILRRRTESVEDWERRQHGVTTSLRFLADGLEAWIARNFVDRATEDRLRYLPRRMIRKILLETFRASKRLSWEASAFVDRLPEVDSDEALNQILEEWVRDYMMDQATLR